FLINKGITREKIHLVANGVDLNLFDPSKYPIDDIVTLRKSFNAKNLIVFSGALQDLNLIINSAKKVIAEYPETKYLILGDHRDPKRSKNMWANLVKENGLENYFIFTGRKPREEVPKFLLCADVCIDSFPDEPYYAAAHPVKLLEYGACNKPIVATRVTETKNLIKENYGLLSNPDNSDEYSNHLISLLKSSELREKLGSKFSLYVRENFNWNKLAKDLEKSLKN
ncbi:MAG: glycosyltransferase, partial [Nitrosopumilus sp.]